MFVKIVGVMSSGVDPVKLVNDDPTLGDKPTVMIHDVDYQLNPITEDGKERVQVTAQTNDGPMLVGYLSEHFLTEHQIPHAMNCSGTMIDYSNGKLKNLSYQVDLDLDLAHSKSASRLSEDAVKVVGTSFRTFEPLAFVNNNPSIDGTRHTHKVIYLLEPEPTNAFDPNAVKVSVQDNSFNSVHIGYVPREFLADHTFTGPIAVSGEMVDTSNGKLKQLSYKMYRDDLERQVEKSVDLSIDLQDLERLEQPINQSL